MALPPGRVRRLRRLAWFAGLYAASLIVFTVLVYGLRALMRL